MEIISDGIVLVLPIISQQIPELGVYWIYVAVFMLEEQVGNIEKWSKILLICRGILYLGKRMNQNHRLINVFGWIVG
jgi:hypothetical protein